MPALLETAPRIELRRGIVFITDETGTRAMPLSVFVEYAKLVNDCARKWVAEANKPDRVRNLKGKKGVE